MKLVVGLGNPGNEYENTRHNAGRILVGLIEMKFEKEGEKKKNQIYYSRYLYEQFRESCCTFN